MSLLARILDDAGTEWSDGQWSKIWFVVGKMVDGRGDGRRPMSYL